MRDQVQPEPPTVGSIDWWDEHTHRLQRRRPRADGLTIERIATAALDLVDRDGLDALTMRQLAAELSSASASLYRHVASRDELLAIVVDHVIGEIALPSGPPEGRAELERLAHSLRRVLLAHPNLLAALASGPLLGPNARRGTDRAVDCLLSAGYPLAVAVPAYLALLDYVLGSVYFDSGRALGDGNQDPSGATSQARPMERGAWIAARWPSDADDIGVGTSFGFGLGVFLDGLESRRSHAEPTRDQRSH